MLSPPRLAWRTALSLRTAGPAAQAQRCSQGCPPPALARTLLPCAAARPAARRGRQVRPVEGPAGAGASAALCDGLGARCGRVVGLLRAQGVRQRAP